MSRDPIGALRDLVAAIRAARPLVRRELAAVLEAAESVLRFGPRPEDERIAQLAAEVEHHKRHAADLTADWIRRVDGIVEGAKRDALRELRRLEQQHRRTAGGLSIHVTEFGAAVYAGGLEIGRGHDIADAIAAALKE